MPETFLADDDPPGAVDARTAYYQIDVAVAVDVAERGAVRRIVGRSEVDRQGPADE